MESDKPRHQPELFEEFELATDSSGFFLSNGDFYQFDKDGGWYDKQGNYYNADGKPATPPDNVKMISSIKKLTFFIGRRL